MRRHKMMKARIDMQVNVEEISSVKKKLNFEIPAERVQAEVDKVFADIRKRAVVPGFRKGKAPQDLIKKSYQGQVEGDVIKNLFNDTYFKYIQENSIYPVAYPVIDTDTFTPGESFKYSATIEIFPTVAINTYVGLEVERETFVADDSAVDKRLQQMRENMAQLKPIAEERPCQSGDHVIIDFVGFVDGEKLDGGEASDYQLELGSNSFIPGFEDQVSGMTVGSEKRITLSFPENYHNDQLSGKEVEFDVTLKEIKVKEMPELDDAFAQEFGEFQTLAELKAKVAESYERQEMDRIDREFKDSIVKALIEKNDFELPDALVDRQLTTMLENTKQRLRYQNLSLEMMGLDESQYKEQFKPVAASQVKGALLLHEIAGKEGIQISKEDLENRVRKIAEESGQDFERISRYYLQSEDARQNLEEQVREEKVLELIASKAIVTEKQRAVA